MKFLSTGYFLNIILFLLVGNIIQAQTVIKGEVTDANSKEPLIGASIVVVGTTDGTITDYDGSFQLKTDATLPLNLSISYIGYLTVDLQVTSDENLSISLDEDAITTEVVEVRGQRISDKQKAAPLTVESLDVLAIKETPSDNFYDGLGSLKGVDLTAASLGFKIVNTRGFNSTSPVRTLQTIDGIDNQAPGLNFSLGNFLGSPELDVLKVDLIVGASSAYYGPNAFNGVIAMETKNPFFQKGLAAQVKAGERGLLETSMRYADVVKNKKGLDFLGYKFNVFYLQANDWEADNYQPIDGSRVPANNPGGFDAVNIYGDEYIAIGDKSSPSNQWGENAGLGTFYRRGYREIDLASYDTRNLKANVGLYFRTQPEKESESPELILGSNFGYGTTVYQGDNRFSLKNITFFQAKVEYSKRDRYFIRAYMTQEDAGDSFDPYFTALRLIEEGKSNESWGNAYVKWWKDNNIGDQMEEMGYPQLNFSTFPPTFDQAAANQWLIDNNGQLANWHQMAQEVANKPGTNSNGFLAPGTPEFEEAYNRITTSYANIGGQGTRFYDKSALYHVHGEYKFTPTFVDEWIVGGNVRLYTPESQGTIFSDTAGIKITNSEFGLYTGITKEFLDNKLRTNITVRVDKNENFDVISTPAASVVWKPSANNYLRVSFSAGVRNPTLNDQYLNLNVGRAILSGNLEGVDSLITLESFNVYRNRLILDSLNFFSIDGVRPERVKTFEVGYRTTLWNSLYVDAGYYYSIYDDFLGFNIGIQSDFDPVSNLPMGTQAYRFAANSRETVKTQGFAIGLSYYFANYYQFNGNYSWNKLISAVADPIIPAFNTPEHKFNVGVSGRGIPVGGNKAFGFNVNYKWIDGFIFEGSPQFTGAISSYQLVDAQVNLYFKNLNTTIKVGASNILDNQVSQTYGGPKIGRLAYISLLYDWKKK